MNPVTSTILTILQYGGYLVVVTYLAMLLTWTINKIVHEYWSCKTACLKMTGEHAPDVEDLFSTLMSMKNGTKSAEGAEKK